MTPLQAALAKVFEDQNRRTKKATAAVSLIQLWGPEEQAASKDLQAAILDCQIFTSSYCEVNDVGISRFGQEDLCLYGRVRYFLC
jgi:hypothetical protein